MLFSKTCSTFKAKQAQITSFCEIFVRSGTLENNHSAESPWVDVTVVPLRFRNVSTLASSTILTFALLLSCGSNAADQHISGLSNTPAGGRIDRRGVSGACLQSNRRATNIPEYGCLHLLGHRDAVLFHAPFRCKSNQH